MTTRTSRRPSSNGQAHKNGHAPSPKGVNGQAAADGRDAAGRFLKGAWKGGPGNPFARETSKRRQALQNAVSSEDIAAIARKWVELALAGDLHAGELIVRYVIGRPTEPPNPDTLDAEELAALLDVPKPLDLLRQGVPPEVAVAALQKILIKDSDKALVEAGVDLFRNNQQAYDRAMADCEKYLRRHPEWTEADFKAAFEQFKP